MRREDKLKEYNIGRRRATEIIESSIGIGNVNDTDVQDKYSKTIINTDWGPITLNAKDDLVVNLTQVPDDKARRAINNIEKELGTGTGGGSTAVTKGQQEDGKKSLYSIVSRTRTRPWMGGEYPVDDIKPNSVSKEYNNESYPEEIINDFGAWIQVCLYKTLRDGKEYGFYVEGNNNVVGVIEGKESKISFPGEGYGTIPIKLHTHPRKNSFAFPSVTDLRSITGVGREDSHMTEEGWYMIGTSWELSNDTAAIMFANLVDKKVVCPDRREIERRLNDLRRQNLALKEFDMVDTRDVEAQNEGIVSGLGDRIDIWSEFCREEDKDIEFNMEVVDMTELGPYRKPQGL
jgi:hypothetical protein